MNHLLVWYIPQSYFPVKRSRYEELVILWMEDNSSHEVNMLEDAETLESADVPQPHRLVHARGQDEVVLRPGHVQEVAGVASVGGKWSVHQDVSR